MIIIDKIKKSAPILSWTPKPLFRTNYEKEKYWANEKVKWIEGVGEVPGMLYFKTQELKIHHRVNGKIFHPVCRYSDLIKHQAIDSCRKKGKILNIIKGRGEGLSADGGCIANYFLRVYPGTKSIITSSEQSKISTFFREKVMIPFRSMDDEIRPVIYTKNESSTACGVVAEIKHLDEQGNDIMSLSNIFTKVTADSDEGATGFSGEGAIFGFYDEFFLHKRRKKLLESSLECFRDPDTGEISGFLLTGGTIEPRLSNAELRELQKLVTEIEKNGMLSTAQAELLFLPFWMTKYLDENGFPNKRKAIDWWDKTMEQIRKNSDTEAACDAERAFRMNNPRTLKDIFELAGHGRWEDDVAEKIKLQTINVISNPMPEEKGKLVDIGGNISFMPNKSGNITILERPRQGVTYYLCVDGTASGKNSGDKDGSNVSGLIVKMFDSNSFIYAPVCLYYERPTTVEQSYINLVTQAKFYDQYGGLKCISAEGNAATADHFATFLSKIGLEKWIPFKKDLSGKGYVKTRKMFPYITVDVRDWQVRQANIFLRKYIENIKLLPLLDELMLPADENTDILDSWLMWFYVIPLDFDKPIKKVAKNPHKVRTITRGVDGSTEIKWVDANSLNSSSMNFFPVRK